MKQLEYILKCFDVNTMKSFSIVASSKEYLIQLKNMYESKGYECMAIDVVAPKEGEI